MPYGKKKSGFKMVAKSPLMKKLTAKQEANLNEGLKTAIEASPAKKYMCKKCRSPLCMCSKKHK